MTGEERRETGGTGGLAADGHNPDGTPDPNPDGTPDPNSDGTGADGANERKPNTHNKDAEKGLNRKEIENEARDKARESIARGIIDFGLLAANSNQLKTVLTIGSNQEFYEVKLTLLSLTLFLQITAGALKILTEQSVGFALKASDRSKRCFDVLLLCVVFAILVLNVFILSFGIAPKEEAATPS